MSKKQTLSKPADAEQESGKGLDETPDCAFSFGDYSIIEQKRYGAPNEMYIHKVIGTLRSNAYVDVPVQCPATETIHSGVVDVVACVCCGVSERQILRYRASDISQHNSQISKQKLDS
jgi:hypothetical protein